MGIEVITRQMNITNHAGLTAVDKSHLVKMRNKSLRDCFKLLDDIPHKMEFVARIQDKRFVDDAASRNINATWYALESTEGSIIWIANGSNDTVDYRRLANVVAQKVKMILCVGGSSDSLHKAFGKLSPTILDCPSMENAVYNALYNGLEKATVIYSPSVDHATGVHEDGQSFRKEVCEL